MVTPEGAPPSPPWQPMQLSEVMYDSGPLGPAGTRSAHCPGNFLGSFVGDGNGKVATNAGSGSGAGAPGAPAVLIRGLGGGRWRPDITYRCNSRLSSRSVRARSVRVRGWAEVGRREPSARTVGVLEAKRVVSSF